MLVSIRSMGDLLRKLHGFKAFVEYFVEKFFGISKKKKTRKSLENGLKAESVAISEKETVSVS